MTSSTISPRLSAKGEGSRSSVRRAISSISASEGVRRTGVRRESLCRGTRGGRYGGQPCRPRPTALDGRLPAKCGAVAEWSKALAWKVSIRQNRIEGSNPSRSANHLFAEIHHHPSKPPNPLPCGSQVYAGKRVG